MNKEERHDYLEKNPAPVIIGPQGVFYPIDHHHLVRAVVESDHAKMVVKIEENWGPKSPPLFWKDMEEAHYIHFYDEKGRGPLPPTQLPHRIDLLKKAACMTLPLCHSPEAKRLPGYSAP